MKKYLTRDTILGFLLCVTIAFVVGDLAFSIRTYHDTVAFALLLIYFIYYFISELRLDKQKVWKRLRSIFYSSKWLFIAFFLYLAYDLITILYAKNIEYALKKLPYMLEYIALCAVAVYYCSTKKRIACIVSTIGITGIIVALGSYIYHGVLKNPIYFQRLSTARDYNVFACLMFITFIAMSYIIVHLNKVSFIKRILLYTALAAVMMPAFYFSGSRRMFIMLPYMLLFVLVYEVIRLKSKVFKNLVFIAVPVVFYLTTSAFLPAFTEYGLQKEADYKQWVKSQQDSGVVVQKPPNSWNETTIGNMIETIEDKSMMNKRSLIYKTALLELKSYSPLDLIFGRGSAYDIHMYDITTQQDILDAYSILEYNVRPTGWMSAHNFMLADILNGGIIKLILGIFLLVQVFIYLIRTVKLKPEIGSAMIVVFCLIVINNSISGTYGILNDVFFYMLLSILIPMKECLSDNEEKNQHNDKCTSS